MSQKKNSGDVSRVVAGQWTKSEKREHATRQIMAARKRTHAINKAFLRQQFVNR